MMGECRKSNQIQFSLYGGCCFVVFVVSFLVMGFFFFLCGTLFGN